MSPADFSIASWLRSGLSRKKRLNDVTKIMTTPKTIDLLRASILGSNLRSRLFIARMFAIRYNLSRVNWVLEKLAASPECGNLTELQIGLLGYNFQIYIDPQDGGDRPSFFEVLYELGPDSLPQPPPELIIDAGAHVGFFSLLARAKYPSAEIHAFEPLPRNFELLRRHICVNSAGVTIHQAALWKEDGIVDFVSPNKSNSGRIKKVSNLPVQQSVIIPVRSVRLSDALPRIRMGRLLLKMDIEGAELDVLENALPLVGKSSMILCELHDTKKNLGRLSELIRQCGWSAQMLKDSEPHSYWRLVSPS